MNVTAVLHALFVNELLQGITLIKMAAAVLIVVVLSILAEVVSPRFAGVLSGYPLGAAISLFFFGFEINPEFAAQSALYTAVGLIATQVFAYLYYVNSLLGRNRNSIQNVIFASLGGVAGYFLCASLLYQFEVSTTTAILLPAASIVFFMAMFRKIENIKIEKPVGLNPRVLLVRAIAAAIFIFIITSAAKLMGPRWAGLFSAFPITMLPFVAIIHLTYDARHVHSILKNVPKGLGSLIAYSLAVYTFYPMCGIYLGTLAAYIFATAYLILIHIKPGRRGRIAFFWSPSAESERCESAEAPSHD